MDFTASVLNVVLQLILELTPGTTPSATRGRFRIRSVEFRRIPLRLRTLRC